MMTLDFLLIIVGVRQTGRFWPIALQLCRKSHFRGSVLSPMSAQAPESLACLHYGLIASYALRFFGFMNVSVS